MVQFLNHHNLNNINEHMKTWMCIGYCIAFQPNIVFSLYVAYSIQYEPINWPKLACSTALVFVFSSVQWLFIILFKALQTTVYDITLTEIQNNPPAADILMTFRSQKSSSRLFIMETDPVTVSKESLWLAQILGMVLV